MVVFLGARIATPRGVHAASIEARAPGGDETAHVAVEQQASQGGQPTCFVEGAHKSPEAAPKKPALVVLQLQQTLHHSGKLRGGLAGYLDR